MKTNILLFGKRLKQIREENNLSQNDLRKLCHDRARERGRLTIYPSDYIERLENNAHSPRFMFLIDMVNSLNASLAWLVGGRKQSYLRSLSYSNYPLMFMGRLICEVKRQELTWVKVRKESGVQRDALYCYRTVHKKYSSRPRKLPTLNSLYKLSEYLGVSMDWLAGRTEDKI